MKRDIADLLIILVIIFVVFRGGVIVGQLGVDPLDVNRDGKANITDLSVLAAEVNERNNGQATLHP